MKRLRAGDLAGCDGAAGESTTVLIVWWSAGADQSRGRLAQLAVLLDEWAIKKKTAAQVQAGVGSSDSVAGSA